MDIPENEAPHGTSGPEIDLPKGFAAPEDSQQGEEVTALCKLKMLPSGRAVIVSIEGAPYEGTKDTPEEEATEGVKMEAAETEAETPPPSEGDEANPSMGLADKIKALRKKLQG